MYLGLAAAFSLWEESGDETNAAALELQALTESLSLFSFPFLL